MGESEKPLVSVVVPTYNRYDRLERALDSVADQTYEPIEVVVVDDCSDVPVENRLSDGYGRAFARFTTLRHDENRGGSAARNTGMEAASGEYIALLDDDDRWRPPKIERQVEEFREADAGVVVAGAEVVDERGNTVAVTNRSDLVHGTSPLTKQLLCRNVVGSCSAVMVDADVVEAVGPFDERFPSWQDLEWYIRLSRHTRFETVCEPLVLYSRGEHGRVSDDLDTIKDESYPLFLEKFGPVAAEYGPLFERKMRAWAAYRVGYPLVLAGRVGEGRRFLTKAVRLYPFEATFYKHYLPALGGTPTYETARKMKRTFDRIQ